MVVGIPKVFPLDGVYKICVLGKHHQEPFDSIKVRQAHNLLELVQSETCYFNIPSLVGARNILTLIYGLSHVT
jgi:hypothetical protein